jgi:regulator of sigma E protease
MSTTGKSSNKIWDGLFWIVALVVAGYVIARHVGVVSNVIVALVGFGAVVLVHEFGHFIVAKLSGIKVEAFSIFMPPTLLGIRRTDGKFKLRVLPSFSGGKDAAAAEGAEAPEATEYRIGLIPFGGYVKLLGQEDTGPVKQIDDPRSFAKKPVSIRIAVISAGVTFNVISAVIIFMTVFLVGIGLPPAVVGGVRSGSPAELAGVKPGDTFVSIAGNDKNLDFSDIQIAAALSDANEPIPVTIRRPTGTVEALTLVAQEMPGSDLREFGIEVPLSLDMAEVADPNMLRERTGLLPGCRITAIDGTQVNEQWEFAEVVEKSIARAVAVQAECADAAGPTRQIETKLALQWLVASGIEVESEADLNYVYSMVPRLRVTVVGNEPRSRAAGKRAGDPSRLRTGDIIVTIGNIKNPTYWEMRDVTAAYEGKSLPVQVLRTDANGVEHTLTVNVEPKKPSGSNRVIIGVGVALDASQPVVAKTIATPLGPPKLEIPRGARIVTVNGKPVSSFYDIIAEVRRWNGQEVTLEYQGDSESEGMVTLQTAGIPEPIRVQSALAEFLPFKSLERVYRADGPLDAIAMGYRRTIRFIALTYITLKQLVSGLISPRNLMGPVGIMALSYEVVAHQPPVYYAYFLGLISATIAVINFLPVPPFDGGLVVLMIIEKIRGAALSERAQGILAYTGWALVLALLVYVTFNDIVRTFFS